MIGMALDGLWRDCCKRALPLPVGGGEGPCPTDDLEVVHTIPQIEAFGLSPVITEAEEGCLVPSFDEIDELSPSVDGNGGEELIPSISEADTDEDC